MDILYQIFVDPFVQMGAAPDLLVQTLWEGLVAGVLYALIALGFVLIFKASGVFNFAQGIMVVFAALTLVGLHEHGVPAFGALAITIVVMFGLAFLVERLVLRPLVNQPDIVLFLATFGLTSFLVGLGEFVFGGEPKVMIAEDLHLPAGAIDLILMVDVYHELSQPQRMLDEMRKALKPDGRLVLIEYRKEDPTLPIRPEHKMSAFEVKTEVEAEGYRLVQVLRTLPRQSIFVFRKQLPS